MNLLIIDDDDLVLEVLKEHFERMSCTVSTYVNLEQAMQYEDVRNFQIYDLAIVDLNIKGSAYDGFEVARALRGFRFKKPLLLHTSEYRVEPTEHITKVIDKMDVESIAKFLSDWPMDRNCE